MLQNGHDTVCSEALEHKCQLRDVSTKVAAVASDHRARMAVELKSGQVETVLGGLVHDLVEVEKAVRATMLVACKHSKKGK